MIKKDAFVGMPCRIIQCDGVFIPHAAELDVNVGYYDDAVIGFNLEVICPKCRLTICHDLGDDSDLDPFERVEIMSQILGGSYEY